MRADEATFPLFAPTRPRLAEALEAITGLDADVAREIVAAGPLTWNPHNGLEWRAARPDGAREFRWTGPLRSMFESTQEAWETLAARGIIPEAWAAQAQRRFYGAEGRALPRDVRASLVFASDPDGIAQAEALGREVAERLGPWNDGRTPQIVWRVLPDGASAVVPNLVAGGRYLAAIAALLRESPNATPPTLVRARRGRSAESLAATARVDQACAALIRVAAAWRRGRLLDDAASVEVRAPDGPAAVLVPTAWRAKWTSQLGDPFEPAEQLWRMGYGLLDVNRRSVVLVAARL